MRPWRCWPPSPSGSAASDPSGPACRSARSRSCGPTSRARWVWPGRSAQRWDARQRRAPRPHPRAPSTAHGGVVVRTEGDAVFAVFPEAGAAVAAAVGGAAGPGDARLARRRDRPRPDGPAHAARRTCAGDDYGGFDVNRAARVAAVGHGGQIILSETDRGARRRRPAGRPLAPRPGPHVLKDLPRPERLFQLDVAGLPTDFPPVRAGPATIGNLPTRG